MTMMTNEEYLSKGGVCCPYCAKSNAVIADQIELNGDGTAAYRNVACSVIDGGCGAEWTDDFSLIGFTPSE